MGAGAPSGQHARHFFSGQYSGMRLENVNRSSLRVPRYAFQTLASRLPSVAPDRSSLPRRLNVCGRCCAGCAAPSETLVTTPRADWRRYSQPIRCVNVTPKTAIGRAGHATKGARSGGRRWPNAREDVPEAQSLRRQRKVREKPYSPWVKRSWRPRNRLDRTLRFQTPLTGFGPTCHPLHIPP